MIPSLKAILLVSALLCMVHCRPNLDVDSELLRSYNPDTDRQERQNPISNILNNLPGPLSPQSPQNPINIINNLLGRTTTKAPEDGEPTIATTRRPFLGGIFNGILNRPTEGSSNGETTTRRAILGGLFTIFNRPSSTDAPTTALNVEVSRPTLPPLNLISQHLATSNNPFRVTATPFPLPAASNTSPPPPIAAPTFMNRIVQIFQQVQNGFTNTLGGLLHLPRNDVPQNVRDSTQTIMKLAESNNINFQPVMDQLPFLAVMSPQRQFESILRQIRPVDISMDQTFFESTNTVLDFLSNPRFSTGMRSRFFENFPNIHNSLQDMWINVSQFMASYDVQSMAAREGNPPMLIH